MTAQQSRRLKQLTDMLMERYISEDEFQEYKLLSELLQREIRFHLNYGANTSDSDDE